MRLSIVSKKIIVAILFASVLLFSLYCFGKKCVFPKLTNLLTIIYKKSSQKPGTLPVAKKEGSPVKSSTKSASRIENLTRSIRLDAVRGVDLLVETLNIKPGMKILDLGAGAGTFTFPFADALKGSGAVFATDSWQDMVDYLIKKASEGNYKNVFPVHVKPIGLDPFYKQHTFDIIFVCDVYELIIRPGEYFRELVPCLEKDNGRIYLIYPKPEPNFTALEFSDFKKIIKILSSEGLAFPVYNRCSRQVRDFVDNWKGQGVPLEIRNKIVDDFNNMLSDRFLFPDVRDYSALNKASNICITGSLVNKLDISLVQWLFRNLDGSGVFDNKDIEISASDKKRLRKLNRILLVYIFSSQEMEYFLTPRVYIFPEKDRAVSTLEEAGFQLVKEYDIFPYRYLLEFKRK